MADFTLNHECGGSPTPQPPDRRRYPRVKCQLPFEIRLQGSQFPIRGETIDVSLGGCYVGTMLPIPIGTEFAFRCWVAATPIACQAVIRTSDPGVGAGIEFLQLDHLSLAILAYHLDRLQSNDDNASESTGIIRAHN